MSNDTLGWFHDDVSDLPEYKQKERYRPMGVDNTGQFIERAFKAGLPLQFNRELVKNAIEAGATIIRICPDPVSLHETGNQAFRYMIADDGCGMSGDELVRFFNKLSSSGKLMDDHGNFGMGAKISLLPWNRAGLIVMSWKDCVGSMVKIVRDPFTGNYALEPWRVSDDEDVFVDYEEAPSEYKPEWMGPNGTVIVCLGNDPSEDTFAGPDGELNTSKKHRNSLNGRFFDFPETVDVSVWEFSTTPRKGEKPSGSFARALGAKSGLDRRAADRGIVQLSDASVRWWLMPDVQQTGKDGQRARTGDFTMLDRGFVAAMYDGELYDTLYGESCKHRHHQFGITWKEVRRNVGLIVEPSVSAPAAHRAAPDTSRRTLLYPGGEELPWARWGEEFAKLMPEPIRAALRRAAPQSSIDNSKLNEKLQKYADRMRFFAVKPSDAADDGSGDGAVTGGAPKGPGPRKKRRRSSGGNGGPKGREYRGEGAGTKGRAIIPKRSVPTADWVNEDEGEFRERAASYLPSENKILINEDFRVFQECFDYWAHQYAPTPESKERVINVVKEVYQAELVSRVYHSMAFEGRAAWRDQFNFSTPPLKGLLSDDSLTMAVLGLINVDHVIATRLGGIFGPAPRREAPARSEDAR